MYCEVSCPVPVLVCFDTVVVRWGGTCDALWAGDIDAYGTVLVTDRLGVGDSEWVKY